MENNQRNSRKRLNSLILLVAFTAIMLIVSTYAWFSTQRNVVLSGLKGEVKVAEGLQMSLDAKHWVNSINFEHFNQTEDPTNWTVLSNVTTTYLDEGKSFQNPADGVTNIVPNEYLPVSTTGMSGEGIGNKIVTMYSGNYTDSDGLTDIDYAYFTGTKEGGDQEMAEAADGGYFAFDLYLMNTSSGIQTVDELLLDAVSDVTGTNEATGIQNTIRVGIALYENGEKGALSVHPMTIGQNVEPTQAQIIAGTSTGRKITDMAIWEPNADEHVDNIVNSNSNSLKLTTTEAAIWSLEANDAGIYKFANGNNLPTYAITSAARTAGSIKNVYDWSTSGDTKLVKQNTTQTTAYATDSTGEDARSASIKLKSVSDGTTPVTIIANQYQKVRVYVWIEGQDPDCINYASLGKGLTLNLGLSKPESAKSE